MDAQVVDSPVGQTPVDQFGNPIRQFSPAELASMQQSELREAAEGRVRGAADAVDQAIGQARFVNIRGERNGISRRPAELTATGHGTSFVTDNQGRVSAVVELDVHKTTTRKSRIPFLAWTIREPRPVATVAITINVNANDQLSASVGAAHRSRYGFSRNPINRLTHREARSVVRASRAIASHLEAIHVVSHPDLQVAAEQVATSDTRYIVSSYRARQEARAAREEVDLDEIVERQLASRTADAVDAVDADERPTYIAPLNIATAEKRPTLAQAFVNALAVAGTREHARLEAQRRLDEQREYRELVDEDEN